MNTRAAKPLRSDRLSAVMLALSLSGCAIPKPGVDRWMNVEGQTNCQIFGDWNRYTWTGACADGYATGNGELVGYGGSTKMWSYTGQLQRGLREGYGIMTYGPMTQTGTFRNGRLFSGTLTGNGQQYVYENGAEVRGGVAARSSDSSDSGLSTFAAVLGGVAQGVAASRGAAAPATQPVTRSYTPTPAPVVAQSPYTTSTSAARATPTPASTPSETYPSANKKVARIAIECLKVDSLSNKGISTESAIMRNSCNEKVNYLYCVDSSNGGGAFFLPKAELWGRRYQGTWRRHFFRHGCEQSAARILVCLHRRRRLAHFPHRAL